MNNQGHSHFLLLADKAENQCPNKVKRKGIFQRKKGNQNGQKCVKMF
jgi:hypothetical protein